MPKITLAQFESKLCDPPANVVKAIPMIRQAGRCWPGLQRRTCQ